MSNRIKIILSTVSIVLIFFIGMAVAHFQIFPYKHIVELRTSPVLNPLKNLVRQSAGSPNAVAATVKNSALQRLLIKEVPLEKYPVLSANYIAESGGILYVISTHGKILSLDLSSYQIVESDIPPVSMNLNQLIESPLASGSDFNTNHFRVLGVYADTGGGSDEQIYVTHHRYNVDEDCVDFTVSRIRLEDGSATSDWETIFTGDPCMHKMEQNEEGSQRFHIRLTSGGAMTPYGENELLFSVGDYGFDGMIHESLSYLPDNMFGKIYRMNKQTGETTVFAEGIRNSQGLYTDKEGTVWATDHGPGGGDELNIIQEGMHYGWPEVSYGIEYGNQAWPHNPVQGRHDGFQKPEYVWTNSIAPTDILRIESDETFTNWHGDLLITSLMDRSLHRVRIEKEEIIYSERIEIGHRVRNILQLSNGSIALMTDGNVLIIIEDGGPVYEPMSEEIKARLNDLGKYNGLLE